MTEKLRDPDLAPGAVVEVRENGTALRNDGVELKPAARNPWYVLATVRGEQPEDGFDAELHAKNRRIWNGWACAAIDDDRRADLAKAMDLSVEDLAPLTGAERSELAEAFRARLGAGVEIPDPSKRIYFSKVHFPKTPGLGKCVLAGPADFASATFSGHAEFRSTMFTEGADFVSVTFSGGASFEFATFDRYADFGSANFSADAYFNTTTFRAHANFGSANFGWDADFESAIFSWDASFEAATFRGYAGFGSATFNGSADFSDEAFGARTAFKGARFKAEVPRFYQRELHQDTSFTTEEDHWPTVTPEIAEDSKRAYTRLRQLMLELEKPDDAHFFFRQEMRCKAFEERHWWNRWPIKAFGWASDYGYSLARPVLCLAALWIVPALIYHGAFTWRCVVDEVCVSLGAPFGLSFANIFPFGLNRLYFEPGLLQGLGPGLKVLGGVQTVLGFLFLFLLGLGLRNRFRLR